MSRNLITFFRNGVFPLLIALRVTSSFVSIIDNAMRSCQFHRSNLLPSSDIDKFQLCTRSDKKSIRIIEFNLNFIAAASKDLNKLRLMGKSQETTLTTYRTQCKHLRILISLFIVNSKK